MQENQSSSLQQAIGELKNSPTVDIKGKSYTQVSTRINIFRKYFPTATIETLITYNDDIRVIIQTKIIIEGTIVATGYAEEIRGDGNYINQTSAVENCETSSIGRALSNFGLGGSEYASSFEVENALSQQKTNNQHYQNTSNHQSYKNERDFTMLKDVGLSVVQNGENLIISGDYNAIFAHKNLIKSLGFRWDPNGSKTWYIPLKQVA